MQKRKEAWLTSRVRDWERPRARDGSYGPDRPVKWFARTPSGGIPGAGEFDATEDVDGDPVPIMDGAEQAKERAMGQALCALYYKDGANLRPYAEADGEGGFDLVRVTVYNWSVDPIPGDTLVETEPMDGDHVAVGAECGEGGGGGEMIGD